jgi:GR25 family glycosyltransferase involved in LPS biosynthesis
MAHAAVWRDFYLRAEGSALVLEDDADIPPDLPDRVRFAESLTARADLVYLGRRSAVADGAPVALCGVLSACYPGVSWQSHAYLLTRHGAEVLLGYGVPDAVAPVDEILSAAYGRATDPAVAGRYPAGLTAMAITPPIPQTGVRSDIVGSAVAGPGGELVAAHVETLADGSRAYELRTEKS